MTKKSTGKKFTERYEFMLLIVVIALTVFLAAATKGRFIKPENLIDLLTSNSAYGVISFGCLFVIISGGIDISFMAVGAVAQYVMALLMLHVGGNFLLCYLIVIVTGAALGFVNAVLVNRLKVPAMIITIGTMNIIYGVMMKASNGKRLHGFPAWFSSKTKLSLFLVSVGTLIVMLLAAYWILERTKTGRKIFAIGGNMEAAKRSGINILKIQLFVYGFAGAAAGLGALIKCYLTQQASIEALYGDEMDVLAMVVLGGVSLSGGKGTVSGTLLGILIISILGNGMTLVGVSSYWKDLVIGAVILISFCITGWRVLQTQKNERKGAVTQ